MENRILYFSYGSNLLSERINRRLFAIIPVYRTYVLEGYRFVFNTGISKKAAFANIIPSPRDTVEGVLYELTGQQFKELSHYEGCYHPEFFIVDNQSVIVYVGNEEYTLLKSPTPSLDYINTIIKGCLEKRLYRTYNELVEYKNKVLKLKSNKHKKIII